LFGGVPLKNHSIPSIYGSYEPTGIKVPLKHFRGKKKRDLLTTELFGPFSLFVEYGDKDLDFLLETLEALPHHLTAAIASNDQLFCDHVLQHTINGTQYTGIKARTTGAP
jgi:1-pyrroline-5-carboxylate dehydrogenase